jgi:hypothetical protein
MNTFVLEQWVFHMNLMQSVNSLRRVRENSEESLLGFEPHRKTIQNCVNNARTSSLLVDGKLMSTSSINRRELG